MIILYIVSLFSLFILIVGSTVRIIEFFRLRNDCETRKRNGKHDWKIHYIVNDTAIRICKDCKIRQFRLGEGYFWGKE